MMRRTVGIYFSSLFFACLYVSTAATNGGVAGRDGSVAITERQRQTCEALEVCFALDETGSISADQFSQQTDAVISATYTLASLSANASSFSAVGFSISAPVISHPTHDVDEFVRLLRSNTQSKGATSTGAGLEACARLLSPLRGVRLIVLISDGADNAGKRGVDVAPGLKNDGFVIAAIAVGSGAPAASLRGIASDEELFSSLSSFEDFKRSSIFIATTLCQTAPEISTPPLPTPTRTLTPTPTPIPSTTTTATPSPSPSSTPSKEPALSPSPRARYPSTKPQPVSFNQRAPVKENLEALRQNVEVFVTRYFFGPKPTLSVGVSLLDSSLPGYPFSLVPRYVWPGRRRSRRSPSRLSTHSSILGRATTNLSFLTPKSAQSTPVERDSVSSCWRANCAARVTIVSSRFIRREIVRRAVRAIRRRPSFRSVYESGKGTFRIVREGHRRFSVFMLFKQSYLAEIQRR